MLRVFEKLIPSIYTNLCFEKLSFGTIKILELYLIGAPFNSMILEKNIEKIIKIFPKINDNSKKLNLLIICDSILKKYENIMKNDQLSQFLQTFRTSLNYETNPSSIQELINSKDWMNFAQIHRQINFKGLLNLGNSIHFALIN